MKQRIFKLTFGLLLLVCLGVSIFLISAASYLYRASFQIAEDKLTVAYLSSKKVLGEYKLVVNVAQNPLITADGAIAYYSVSGNLGSERTENYIAISNDKAKYAELLAKISAAECRPSKQTTGSNGDLKYIKGMCGRTAYYLYSSAAKWIYFNAEDGIGGLDKMMLEYLR